MRLTPIILLSSLVLVVAGAAVLVAPGPTRDVAGLMLLGAPLPPDELRDIAMSEAGAFFADRDSVTLRVPEEMTVRDLLRLYEMDLPHVRAGLAEQLGVSVAGVGSIALSKGRELTIRRLTPPLEDDL